MVCGREEEGVECKRPSLSSPVEYGGSSSSISSALPPPLPVVGMDWTVEYHDAAAMGDGSREMSKIRLSTEAELDEWLKREYSDLGEEE